jgi:hypothetical protein
MTDRYKIDRIKLHARIKWTKIANRDKQIIRNVKEKKERRQEDELTNRQKF